MQPNTAVCIMDSFPMVKKRNLIILYCACTLMLFHSKASPAVSDELYSPVCGYKIAVQVPEEVYVLLKNKLAYRIIKCSKKRLFAPSLQHSQQG